MHALQRQVDAEFANLKHLNEEGPTTSFYASPALVSTVHKLLRWIREKVATR